MKITDAAEPSSVRIALEFLKLFTASNATLFTLEPTGTGTGAIWDMTGRNTLMMQMVGVFKSMGEMIGPDFEKGLRGLQTTAEAAAA